MARKSRKNIASADEHPVIKVWKTALYIRLSVEYNGKRGDSLETQRQIMEDCLALCPDVEITEIYIDNGVSGQTFDRQGFQKMLADIESGKIDCVVVKDLSRLGRNAIDTGYYTEYYFPLHHVRFIAVNDRYDSEDAGSGSSFALPIKNIVNEGYALEASRKTRLQLQRSMMAGEFVGARPPYGYRKDPENCHRLLVNEDTAPVIRQIFRWAADGAPLDVIVRWLNEADVLTPGYYLASIGLITSERLMGSGKWQTWTIRKILSDQVYTGDMVQGKTSATAHKQSLVRPEDWIVVKGTHEPLVSRELFDQVQVARAQASRKGGTQTERVPYTENILRGKIFCGCCGKSLHRQRSHGRYVYHCIANDRIGKGACLGKVRLREADLFSVILTTLQKEGAAIIENSFLVRQMGDKAAGQKTKTAQEVSELRQEIEQDRKHLRGLYESFVAGRLTRLEYQAQKAGYEQKIDAASAQARQLLERQELLEKEVNGYLDLSVWLASVFENPVLTASLADRVIERIDVSSSKDIDIHFKFKNEFYQTKGVEYE